MGTRSGSFSTGMLVLALAVLSCVNEIRIVGASEGPKPSLVFYMHEQWAVPGEKSTNILSVSPTAGNVSFLFWGDLALSEQFITAGQSNTSALIGNAPAFFYKNKKQGSYTVQKLITLNTEKYNGTFVTSSTFQSLNDFTSSNELAVSGGTGSFRDVGGYAIVTLVSRGVGLKVYKYEVFLTRCKRYRVTF